MLVYTGLRRKIGSGSPTSIPGLVGWWKQGDWTSSGERVSQWSDTSGNARHLLQATGANQPIELPWSGENYAWLPGVSGNYLSTPDSAALDITGSISFIARIAVDNLTSGASRAIISKWVATGNQRSYQFSINASNQLQFNGSPDGTSTSNHSVASSVTLDSVAGHGNFDWIWVMCTVVPTSATGANFYYAADSASVPTSWTLLGAADRTITNPAALYSGTGILEMGSVSVGTANLLACKVKRALVYSGIVAADGTGGTLVADCNPTLQTEGATSFVSATTGETWTVNATGAKQAQIVGSPQIVGDGAAMYMRSVYTQDQPLTRFVLFRRNTNSAIQYVYDGATGTAAANALRLPADNTATIAANSVVGTIATPTPTTWMVQCGVFNGASSFNYVNTVNSGAVNAGSFTSNGMTVLASSATGNFAPAQTKEVIEYNRALSTTEVTTVLRYLSRKGNLGLAI